LWKGKFNVSLLNFEVYENEVQHANKPQYH